MLTQLGHGWREFSSRSWLWIIVVQFGLYRMVVYGPFIVLGAVLADRYMGGSSAWALILSAQGAGAIVGGFAMQRYAPVDRSWSRRWRRFPLPVLSPVWPLGFRTRCCWGIRVSRRWSRGLRNVVGKHDSARNSGSSLIAGRGVRLARVVRIDTSWLHRRGAPLNADWNSTHSPSGGDLGRTR